MTTTTAETIIGDIRHGLTDVFSRIEWAEDEIDRAQKRHPDQADTLYHCFPMLCPREATGTRMSTEAVYRAHARELLERVAAGQDTRAATAVEIVIGLLEAASLAPLTHDGYALCARMWAIAGLPDIDDMTDKLGHYEAINPAGMDEQEQSARRACRDDSRKLGVIDCAGMHHGEAVACQYSSPAVAA